MVLISYKYEDAAILKCTTIVIFHSQEDFHLHPCTSCLQSLAWGWLLVSTPKMPTQGDSVLYNNSGICSPGNSPHIGFHISCCHSIHSSHFPSGPRTGWQGEASTSKRSISEWAKDVKRGPVPACLEYLDAICLNCSFNVA